MEAAARLHQAGRFAEAEKLYAEVLRTVRDAPRLLEKLAQLCYQQNKVPEAKDFLRRAFSQEPDNTRLMATLAQLCYEEHNLPESIELLRQACGQEPDNPEFRFNLGAMLDETGNLKEAVHHYRQVLQINPNHDLAYASLGTIYHRLLDYSAAIDCYGHALRIDSNNEKALIGLGVAEMCIGQSLEANERFRRALTIAPYSDQTAFLFNLHNLPDITDKEIFSAHIQWARMHTANITQICHEVRPARSTDAPIRVGYVSADFCYHSVANFIIPVLQAHDRSQVTSLCFSDVVRPDATTDRIRALAHYWHDISKLDNDQAAALIKEQNIDVLVDLAGHTSGNRLLLFARKPAPVQVSYLGYPDTTGLPAMDYRITDALADPAGVAEQRHTERLVRIAPCFLCYQPSDDAPAVAVLPAEQSGHVTFGSFNNLSKITEDTIALWAEILKRNSGATLVMKAKGLGDKKGRSLVYARFADQGITPERIACAGFIDGTRNHLQWYDRVDISLDTFPYNGTTTTLQSLWMGVPVVTLAGSRHAARVGGSLLSCIGLDYLIASSAEEYVALASRLAGDIAVLSGLRRSLRQRMSASPLMDKLTFTGNLERSYRKMLQNVTGA